MGMAILWLLMLIGILATIGLLVFGVMMLIRRGESE